MPNDDIKVPTKKKKLIKLREKSFKKTLCILLEMSRYLYFLLIELFSLFLIFFKNLFLQMFWLYTLWPFDGVNFFFFSWWYLFITGVHLNSFFEIFGIFKFQCTLDTSYQEIPPVKRKKKEEKKKKGGKIQHHQKKVSIYMAEAKKKTL